MTDHESSVGVREQRHLPDEDGDASGLILYDADGLVLSANLSAQQLLGALLPDIRGPVTDGPWAVVDRDGRPLPVSDHPLMRALSTGRPVRAVVLGVLRPTVADDGAYVWLEVDSEPLYQGRQRRPYAVVATFREVTTRTWSDVALRESETQYRQLADNGSDVIARTSIRGIITWVSPAVERLLGYQPHDLTGSSAAHLVHPEDLAAVLAVFRSRLGAPSREVATIDMRLRAQGGLYVPVEVVLQAVRGADGVATEIQSSTRDVSARIASEAARRSAEDVFRLALEHAPMGMAVLELDGGWVTVNSALPRITGHTPEELELTRLIQLVHPDDRDDVAACYRAMTEEGLPAFEREIRLVTAAGGEVWVELCTTVVSDARGSPRYFVVQVVDISQRKRAQDKLVRRAVTDPLTGLPNRSVLNDRLEHALARCRREGRQIGLVFIDLDHFKHLNDVFGHDAGDEVLRELSRRLSRAVRDGDTAVRLGGDEFVVLCEEHVALSELQTLADRLLRELGRPYDFTWGEATISCSFGLTVGNGPDAASLLQEADLAMYRAKHQGRSRISVFDRAAQAEALYDLGLETQLERAISEGELRIHYQPIVRLADQIVHAREALVRWQHPTRGLLNPALFIPVAELSPLITTMGRWMMREACSDAAGWADEAIVCVNISPRHLAQADFPASVAQVLEETGLRPDRLQIEITEASILQVSTSTLTSTARLTELGVTLALDDFGTGYSSLTALHRLPISTLKIDKSFVQDLPEDPGACALVNGLIQMAGGLGIDVIAEGVETPEQAQWLRDHTCQLVQGFHFGRPKATSLTNASHSRRSGRHDAGMEHAGQ